MKKFFYLSTPERITLLIMNKLVIGKTDKKENKNIAEKLAFFIAKVDDIHSKDELIDILSKKLTVIVTKDLILSFGESAACGLNKIVISKHSLDYILSKDVENLYDSDSIQLIVHEAIHFLQAKRLYKGKDIIGFIEGVTEYMTCKSATKEGRSHVDGNKKYNFESSTAYPELVALFSLFNVILDEETLKKFAFTKDCSFIDQLESLLGKEYFKELRKDMNRYAYWFGKGIGSLDRLIYSFDSHQDMISEIYLDKLFEGINSKEDAELFLKKMNEINNARTKKANGKDPSFKKLFERYTTKIKERYPEISEELLIYMEAEMYPNYTYNDLVQINTDSIHDNLFRFSFDKEDNGYEEYSKLDLSKYRRYRCYKNNRLFELITVNDEPYYFIVSNHNGAVMSGIISNTPNFKDFVFSKKDDNICFSSSKYKITDFEFSEIDLGITKADIYESSYEDEVDFQSIAFSVRFLGKKVKMDHIPDYYDDPSKEAIPVSERKKNSKKDDSSKKEIDNSDKINEEYKISLITELIKKANKSNDVSEEYFYRFLMEKSIEELEDMINNTDSINHSSKSI